MHMDTAIIDRQGIEIHSRKSTTEIEGLADYECLDFRPGTECGLSVGERVGIKSTDGDWFIGEIDDIDEDHGVIWIDLK